MDLYFFLLLFIASSVYALVISQSRRNSRERKEAKHRCPYCDKPVPQKALLCPSCNGALGIGSFEAIREALEKNPLLVSQDSESKARLHEIVSDLDNKYEFQKRKEIEENEFKIKEKFALKEQRLASYPPLKRFVFKNWIAVLIAVGFIGILANLISNYLQQRDISKFTQAVDIEISKLEVEYCSAAIEFINDRSIQEIVKQSTERSYDGEIQNQANSAAKPLDDIYWKYIDLLNKGGSKSNVIEWHKGITESGVYQWRLDAYSELKSECSS